MAIFALTIFAGAFLLFQVQPLIAKYILPWFGGGPGVWTTCMLFFQVLLLGGYAYVHATSRWLKTRTQIIIHLALVVAALTLLPISPSDSWKPTGSENPTWRILALLTVSLGLPYFILSATGPLMQQWFCRAYPGRSPYRLYALSSVGSLMALVTYPIYFETHFSRTTQALIWGWGFVAFVVCCGGSALRLWRATGEQGEGTLAGGQASEPILTGGSAPSVTDKALWVALPACASVLLLATTNKICEDVAVIPFLWVVPLALYLLSFILCFDSSRWYRRGPFGVALFGASAAIWWALGSSQASLPKLLTIYNAGLFVCCMVCHGELYRLKPDPRQLTSYYLLIAAGGAAGGLAVAVVAPLLLRDFYELQWGLLLCGLLFFLCFARQNQAQPRRVPVEREQAPGETSTDEAQTQWYRLARNASAIGLALLALLLWIQAHQFNDKVVERARNFYGVLTVREEARDNPTRHFFALDHGKTIHGMQFVHSPESTWPTAYYSERSGVGLALAALAGHARRIGLVGLGIGTLSVYAKSNDAFRYYEINPEVLRLAASRFSYLTNCHANQEFILGDARLSLEREAPQQFDLLILDAFSGDAVPVHLLTREAFALYQRHLKTNGVIAVHVSNKYVDLEPVLVNVAVALNYRLAAIESVPPPSSQDWIAHSFWVLLTRDQDLLKTPAIRGASRPPHASAKVPLWTDNFTSLYQILH